MPWCKIMDLIYGNFVRKKYSSKILQKIRLWFVFKAWYSHSVIQPKQRKVPPVWNVICVLVHTVSFRQTTFWQNFRKQTPPLPFSKILSKHNLPKRYQLNNFFLDVIILVLTLPPIILVHKLLFSFVCQTALNNKLIFCNLEMLKY